MLRINNLPPLIVSHLQGQVKELDGLAHTFMAAAADRKALLKQAQAAADAVDTSNNPDAGGYVEYYIKTMQRVLDKGDAYIEQVRSSRASSKNLIVLLALAAGAGEMLGRWVRSWLVTLKWR
jgi:pyruvate/oxaloacetate carboxyltransferase